jgi:hypothetical protein
MPQEWERKMIENPITFKDISEGKIVQEYEGCSIIQIRGKLYKINDDILEQIRILRGVFNNDNSR